MSNTKLLSHDANGVTFADPTDPDFTVRFKTTRNRKLLNSMPVDNFIHEIIVSDLNEVEVKGQAAVDTLAFRIRVSGSSLSRDRMIAVLKSIVGQVPDWVDSDTIFGFEPSIVPINPTA